MDATDIRLEDLVTPFAERLLKKRGQPKEQKQPDLRAGDLCPACGKGQLRFDGLLNLTCSGCQFVLAGCFT